VAALIHAIGSGELGGNDFLLPVVFVAYTAGPVFPG
jgi:hypothetical protein